MPEFTYFFVAAMLVGMLAAMEIGRQLARRHADVASPPGVSALEGAVYGLFGLLLAFIFSGATTRYEQRRDLIVQEANAIGTAWLRLDLLPADSQATLRPLFREYVESRLATFRSTADPVAWAAENQRDLQLQTAIWKAAVDGAKRSGAAGIPALVLPPLNEMIDLTTVRLAATRAHPPAVIYAMLLAFGIASALLSGMAIAGGARRPWPHILTFALTIAVTTYVILDIEYPRFGLVRVDAADKFLVDLLASMK